LLLRVQCNRPPLRIDTRWFRIMTMRYPAATNANRDARRSRREECPRCANIGHYGRCRGTGAREAGARFAQAYGAP
jgi:hypothetical protein